MLNKPMNSGDQAGFPEESVHYCAIHSNVQTGLACSRCGKYICPRCLIQTPVGSRCPDCGRGQRIPTMDVSRVQLAVAIATAITLSIAFGTVWGIFFPQIHRIPFFPWLVAVGVGYFMGEGVSFATNRRRAISLACIAGAGTIAAFVISGFVFAGLAGIGLLFRDLFGILMLGFAVYIAVSRVR